MSEKLVELADYGLQTVLIGSVGILAAPILTWYELIDRLGLVCGFVTSYLVFVAGVLMFALDPIFAKSETTDRWKMIWP